MCTSLKLCSRQYGIFGRTSTTNPMRLAVFLPCHRCPAISYPASVVRYGKDGNCRELLHFSPERPSVLSTAAVTMASDCQIMPAWPTVSVPVLFRTLCVALPHLRVARYQEALGLYLGTRLSSWRRAGSPSGLPGDTFSTALIA